MALNEEINNSITNQEALAVLQSTKDKFNETGDIESIQENIRYLSEALGYSESEITNVVTDTTAFERFLDEALEIINNPLTVVTKSAGGLWNTFTTYLEGGDNLDWKDSIIGLPFRFNAYTDPRNRIFVENFLPDLQIITFDVGLPQFRGTDEDLAGFHELLSDSGIEDSEAWVSRAAGFGVNSNSLTEGLFNWLLLSQKDLSLPFGRDLRFYSFKPARTDYYKYVEILLNTVATKIGVNAQYANVAAYFSKKNMISNSDENNSGMRFCCKRDISISESMSNDFKDSQLAGKTKEISDAAREIQFLTGQTPTSSNLVNKISDIIDGIGTNLGSIFNNNALGNGLQSAGEGLGAAVSGINLFYPQIWSDSSFSRSYSVNFSFVSPYGDPDSIFYYVYAPFLFLVAMSFPRQFMGNGYSSPFLIRADVPGLFTTDLAVITSINWNKGGSDGLFTKDGLPLAMDVSINIKDLYPIFPIPGNWVMLRHNTGMHGFLDNLAGLHISKMRPFENWANGIEARWNYFKGRARRAINGWVEDKVMSAVYALNGR